MFFRFGLPRPRWRGGSYPERVVSGELFKDEKKRGRSQRLRPRFIWQSGYLITPEEYMNLMCPVAARWFLLASTLRIPIR